MTSYILIDVLAVGLNGPEDELYGIFDAAAEPNCGWRIKDAEGSLTHVEVNGEELLLRGWGMKVGVVPRLKGGVTKTEGESLTTGNLNEFGFTGVDVEGEGCAKG